MVWEDEKVNGHQKFGIVWIGAGFESDSDSMSACACSGRKRCESHDV